MPIRINVSFLQKDEAKKKGAIWIPEIKTWVIPDYIKDINSFKLWLPQNVSTIVKSPLLLARSSRTCWKCRKETPLIALASRSFFTTVFNSPLEKKWEYFEFPVVFVHILNLGRNIVSILEDRFPFFQQRYSEKFAKNFWVNTCIHCQTKQGDDYNIDIPGVHFGGYQNEKKTLFRGKSIEQILIEFDCLLDASIYEGHYHWDGFSEAE